MEETPVVRSSLEEERKNRAVEGVGASIEHDRFRTVELIRVGGEGSAEGRKGGGWLKYATIGTTYCKFALRVRDSPSTRIGGGWMERANIRRSTHQVIISPGPVSIARDFHSHRCVINEIIFGHRWGGGEALDEAARPGQVCTPFPVPLIAYDPEIIDRR